MKTHSGAKKRFRKTAKGKLRGRRAYSTPHPREEVAEAEAALPAAGRDLRRRREAGPHAARGWQVSRVKRSVHARKKRRKVLKEAKGYFGRKHSSYRFAKEQVQRSGMYAYRDRRNRKRDFRRLWIIRINAAARREGMSYSELMHGLKRGRGRGEPQDAGRRRGQRPRRVPPIRRARPGGRGSLAAPDTTTLPGGPPQGRPFFCRETTSATDDHKPPQREAEAGPQARRAQAPRARGPVRHRGRGPAGGRAARRREPELC